MPNHSQELEHRVQALGATILDAARLAESSRSVGERWIGDLLEKSMENERLRVQALRFVDVLPSLGDDTELARWTMTAGSSISMMVECSGPSMARSTPVFLSRPTTGYSSTSAA